MSKSGNQDEGDKKKERDQSKDLIGIQGAKERDGIG